MLLRELVQTQLYADDFCKFYVNGEKLTREIFKKYYDCCVISWEVSRYSTNGFRIIHVLVDEH